MTQLETVKVVRASQIVDEYGDFVDGVFVEHLSLLGRFAPRDMSEPVEVGSDGTPIVATVYVRGLLAVPDVKSTDRVVVRGGEFLIDGEPAVWRRNRDFGLTLRLQTVVD